VGRQKVSISTQYAASFPILVLQGEYAENFSHLNVSLMLVSIKLYGEIIIFMVIGVLTSYICCEINIDKHAYKLLN
jgi:hypothetical protein